MGVYTLEYIIQEWSKGKLSEEQAIGQLLLLLQALQERVERAEGRLARLEQKAKQ